MTDVILFVPLADRTASENMARFVNDCRDKLSVFGRDLHFESDVWDITAHIGLKGKRSASTLRFFCWGESKGLQGSLMPEPFKGFAKSYVRYQQGLRPSASLESRLIALRALCAALLEGGGEPLATRLLPFHFNRAAQLIQERVKPTSAYQYGIQLEMIASTMCECGLLGRPFSWRSPIQRLDYGGKVGKEFDQRRMAKLPSSAALAALASIFQVAEDLSAIVVTSAVALMCSAPERINEVLRLSVHSEVNERQRNDGEFVYGLRWFPSKGATPQVKWIVQSMTSTVRAAVAKLRKISQPARALAHWYEANPSRIFLPPHLEYLRNQEFVNMDELAEVLFESPVDRTVVGVWCKSFKIEKYIFERRAYVKFIDLEALVVGMLPVGFPLYHAIQGLRYSDALFLVRRNELHKTRATYRCMFSVVVYGDINGRLSTKSAGMETIFEIYGYREPDGSSISVSTHQFRHYLNTIAQLGGLSQMDIALWSGRAHVGENKAYDHVSNRDALQLMRTVAAQTSTRGALAPLPEAALVLREDFARVKVRTAHATDFGYCGHDFTMLPCQAHQDCLNCDEHVCIKGDAEKERRLRMLVTETRGLLETAEKAQGEKLAGASRWVDHQRRTLHRAEEILRVVDDASVPSGAVMKVAVPQMPSQLALAIQDRQRLLTAEKPSAANALARGGRL